MTSPKSDSSNGVYSLADHREYKKLKTALHDQLGQVRELRDNLTDQMVAAHRINMFYDFD